MTVKVSQPFRTMSVQSPIIYPCNTFSLHLIFSCCNLFKFLKKHLFRLFLPLYRIVNIVFYSSHCCVFHLYTISHAGGINCVKDYQTVLTHPVHFYYVQILLCEVYYYNVDILESMVCGHENVEVSSMKMSFSYICICKKKKSDVGFFGDYVDNRDPPISSSVSSKMPVTCYGIFR